MSSFLFYFIFAKNKLFVLPTAPTLALRPTQAHQTQCTGNSLPGNSPPEHENDNSSPPIPKLRMCEPVPSLPHTPSQCGMYGRIILFCRNTTLRKRSFSSTITADTLSFINSWYKFRSPHPMFALAPCYDYRESKISQFGVTMFSIVNTYQVL